MNDPLEGLRQSINEGETDRLLWPDTGQDAPVEVGQIFQLRSCSIEITRVHRVQPRGRGWQWRAEFKRYVPHSELYLLGSRGYTDDPKSALRAQDSADPPTITDLGDRPESHRSLGQAPEPEGVAPDEVANLPSTVAARRRFNQIHSEDTEKRLDRSLANTLRELRIRSRHRGVDVSEETEQIRDALSQMRGKLEKAA